MRCAAILLPWISQYCGVFNSQPLVFNTIFGFVILTLFSEDPALVLLVAPVPYDGPIHHPGGQEGEESPGSLGVQLLVPGVTVGHDHIATCQVCAPQSIGTMAGNR